MSSSSFYVHYRLSLVPDLIILVLSSTLLLFQLFDFQTLIVLPNSQFTLNWFCLPADCLLGTGVERLVLETKLPIVSEDALVQQYDDYLAQHPSVKFILIGRVSSFSSLFLIISLGFTILVEIFAYVTVFEYNP